MPRSTMLCLSALAERTFTAFVQKVAMIAVMGISTQMTSGRNRDWKESEDMQAPLLSSDCTSGGGADVFKKRAWIKLTCFRVTGIGAEGARRPSGAGKGRGRPANKSVRPVWGRSSSPHQRKGAADAGEGLPPPPEKRRGLKPGVTRF